LDELEGKIAVTKELQKHPWACRDLAECARDLRGEADRLRNTLSNPASTELASVHSAEHARAVKSRIGSIDVLRVYRRRSGIIHFDVVADAEIGSGGYESHRITGITGPFSIWILSDVRRTIVDYFVAPSHTECKANQHGRGD
jgi:hypothetical protein